MRVKRLTIEIYIGWVDMYIVSERLKYCEFGGKDGNVCRSMVMDKFIEVLHIHPHITTW